MNCCWSFLCCFCCFGRLLHIRPPRGGSSASAPNELGYVGTDIFSSRVRSNWLAAVHMMYTLDIAYSLYGLFHKWYLATLFEGDIRFVTVKQCVNFLFLVTLLGMLVISAGVLGLGNSIYHHPRWLALSVACQVFGF